MRVHARGLAIMTPMAGAAVWSGTAPSNDPHAGHDLGKVDFLITWQRIDRRGAAQRKACEALPEDSEVQVFYALAHLATSRPSMQSGASSTLDRAMLECGRLRGRHVA